jgi:hypothetical protein
MENKSKAFISKLDELIELFTKLRDKATKEGILIKNDPLYRNFELLSGNYQMIKNNIPDELIEELGEPIKEIITQMVEQLKRDLGVFEPAEKSGLMDEIKTIDQHLKKEDLSEKEINHLLDKRASLNTKL